MAEASVIRVEARRLLEVAALTGLAFVQPLLDVLGRSPETFVFRRVDGTDLVVFAVGVALLPGLVLWGLGLLSRFLGDRVRRGVHAATLVTLVGLAVLVAVKSTGHVFGASALALAVVAGALGLLLYLRISFVRLFLGYLSVLPVLAAGVFLFSSPVSGLVDGGGYDIVEDPGTTTPLVILVVDELPTAALLDVDGDVDRDRFPNFARLSREARWYRNYTTVNNFTLHAVPALASGVDPDTDAVPLLADHPANVFTFLGGAYDVNVDEAVTRLCPGEVCPGGLNTSSHSGLRGVVEDSTDVLQQLVSLDAYPGPQSDFFIEPIAEPGPDGVQPERFVAFLDGFETTGRPGLHFLHLVLPHEPYRFFPDGTRYGSPAQDPRGDPDGRWVDEWSARFGHLRFELQARYVDRLVGQMIDRLEQTGLWDDAVVAVVADHGSSFTEGQGRRVLTEANAHEILWSTLFVRAPGLEPGTSDVNMVSTDLLPTLADLMGTEVPYAVDGRSILDVDDGSDVSAAGDKIYFRFSNKHFHEPDAVLQIDSASNLAVILDEAGPGFDAEDPVGSLYRDTVHGDLYDQPIEELAVEDPADAVATVERLDRIRADGADPLSAYIGGGIESPEVPDDAWVVAVVDGVVSGFSPMFEEERRDRGFHLLLAPDRVGPDGVDLELYIVESPGAALRPIEVRQD